jgi:hypothetical protein
LIKGFLPNLLLGAVAYGALFSYLVAVPILYHRDIGLEVVVVGLILALNTISLVTTGFTAGYFIKHIRNKWIYGCLNCFQSTW